MLVQQSTIGVLGRLCWYRKVLTEHSGGCAGTAEYYRSTREAVLVLHRNIVALLEHLGECSGLVQQSTIEALGRLCWYNRVQLEHLEGCFGLVEYYRRTRAALLVQTSITG